MVENKLNRTLGFEEFEYGNHVISVEVILCKKYIRLSMNLRYGPFQNGQQHYTRVVKVEANKDDSVEITNMTNVVVDAEEEVTSLLGGDKIKNKIPPLREQISETVKPVFEELDELYVVTDKNQRIDIESATHEIQAEKSWVGIEGELERISKEIDELAV